MKRKNTKPWIILIVAPFVTLLLTMILQTAVRFALSSTESGNNAIQSIINVISLLLGIVSVIAILGLPLWIIMLVVAIGHNKKLDTQNPLPVQDRVNPELNQYAIPQQPSVIPTEQEPPTSNQK